MHSWRVLILPNLDQMALYEAYDFSEPWDGPKNKKLLTARPNIYACPAEPDAHAPGAIRTSYVAVVGPQSAWTGEKSRKLDSSDFVGSAGNTIMVVEAADSTIPWTEPRDLSLDALAVAEAGLPALTVSSNHGRREDFFFIYDRDGGVNVAMANGRARYLPLSNLPTTDLRKILQIGGCKEEIDFDNTLYNHKRHLNWPHIAALAVWLLSVGTLLTQAVRSRKRLSPPAAPPPAGSTSGPPVE
jgi:hypothetical protein